MANLKIKDGDGTARYLSTTGAGTDGDPFVPQQAVTATLSTVAMTTATGTVASSGDNTIVAAPSAGNRLVIHDLQVQLEAATATTILIKSGSTTIRRLYAGSQGDGILLQLDPGKEIRLGAAEALALNLSGANSVGYSVRYTTEAV